MWLGAACATLWKSVQLNQSASVLDWIGYEKKATSKDLFQILRFAPFVRRFSSYATTTKRRKDEKQKNKKWEKQ